MAVNRFMRVFFYFYDDISIALDRLTQNKTNKRILLEPKRSVFKKLSNQLYGKHRR